jgi:hypothetical protein
MSAERGLRMTGVCIYKRNRGLGACVGPVSRIKVACKTTLAWKGLRDLAERLKTVGEEPGVCKAHEKRGGENGYLLDLGPAAPAQKSPTGKRGPRPAPPSNARVAPHEGHSGAE